MTGSSATDIVTPDLEFIIDNADLLTPDFDATNKVWFEAPITRGAAGILYVSTDADIEPEFSIELTGVKSLTEDDLILLA